MDLWNEPNINKAISFYINDKNNKTLLIDVLSNITSSYSKETVDKFICEVPAKLMNEEDVIIEIIELYIRLADYPTIMPLVSTLMKLTSNHPLAVHYAVLANFFIGENKEVVKLANRHQTIPETTIFIAKALYLMGDIISAIVKLEAEKVDDADSLGILAIMYFDVSEQEVAHLYANMALRQDSRQFDALLTKASLYFIEFELELAHQLISKLLIMQPENSRVLSLKKKYSYVAENKNKCLTLFINEK